MRTLAMMFAALLLATPAMAQEEPSKKEAPKEASKDPPKETPKDTPKDQPKDGAKTEDAKREMSAAAKSLFEDIKRVYTKFYEDVLEKTKADQRYNAADLWNAAVKKAQNATYKDHKEFDEAVLKMKKADKVFSREFTDYQAKMAKESSDAITEWVKKSEK